MNQRYSFVEEWKVAWSMPWFRLQSALSFLALLAIVIFIPCFFNYVQGRTGPVLHDPLLQIIGPIDLSWITFLLIYASVILVLINLLSLPLLFLKTVKAYCLLMFLRVVSMYFAPLNEPAGIIVLRDPLVAIIGYGDRIITKDLFFSGHVSTMFLLSLSASSKWLKRILFLNTFLIASLILFQHVHYTIDVLVAPLFAFISFYLVRLSGSKSPGKGH